MNKFNHNADHVMLKKSPASVLWGSGATESQWKQPHIKLRRSDMLLKNQVSVMKSITNTLKTIVMKLENSSNEDGTLLQQIFILDRQAQHLKIVLEVLAKINLEIQYWRTKLHISMKGHEDEAELIRQRIQWLEHRLEKIVAANTEKQLLQKFQIPFVFQNLKKTRKEFPKRGDVLPTASFVPFKKSVILQGTEEEAGAYEAYDEGSRYWMSDHHRFIYTPDIKDLLKSGLPLVVAQKSSLTTKRQLREAASQFESMEAQMNPLSYNSVGLAVPASYVDKRKVLNETESALPWLTEQNPMKGNFDIMREELEHLRKRMFQIHDKIYDAANLSVNLDLEDHFPTPVVKIHSVTPQSALTTATTTPYKEVRSTKADDNLPTKSPVVFSESQIPSEYITTGDILPITRTDTSKKYPFPCDHWSNARPSDDDIDRQPIIVNQRDLRNKTKLRLFVPKRTKKRRNVQRDLITPSSVTSNRSYRKGAPAVRFIENLKSSDGTSLSDLQRERLDDLLDSMLVSPRAEDRVYATRSLTSLGATARDRALPALMTTLQDQDSAVRFGAAKALISLGEWHETALNELISLLKAGHRDVCIEIMNVLSCCEQARYMSSIFDERPELSKLIKVLSKFAMKSNDDEIIFQASVCLGEICGNSDDNVAEIARTKLIEVIKTTSKWDWHSQALEVLVRRLHYLDEDVLKAVITQLKHAVKWKDRLAAALLIACGGPTKVFLLMDESEAFELFYHKLWDDPKREVRLGMSQAFTALGMRNRLLESLDQYITNPNAEIRAHAVIAMSAVGIKNDKTLRSLIEMLGLDSSDYVRLQIMRTFHALTITDIRAVRALREREKSGGPLAREASKILASLDVRLTTAMSTSPSEKQSGRFLNQVALQTRSGTDFSWTFSPWRRSRSDCVKTNQSQRYARRDPTSSSIRSSSDLMSSPRYEVISTSGRKFRRSRTDKRIPTAETVISSVSSFC